MRRALVFGLIFALPALALAQSARPGMRLTVTRVAPSGGYTANGFLVVHTTTVARTPAPECGAGAVRIDAEGHATGRVHAAHVVVVATPEDHASEIDTSACGARIDVTLDDGTHVVPQHGTAHAHLVGASGLDATLESTQLDASGVPITVSGHIVLSPA